MRCIGIATTMMMVGAVGCASPTAPFDRAIAAPSASLNRHSHRVEIVGSELHVLGGFARGKAFEPDRGGRDALVFDTITGRELASTHLPASLQACSSVVLDGIPYAVGGGMVARFDRTTGTWIAVTPADVLPNSHLSAVALDGGIIVAGGFPFRESLLVKVDLRTGATVPLTPPPDVRKGEHFMFLVVLNGALHVLGGINESELSDRHWVLRPDGWQRAAPLPGAACSKFAAYGVVDGSLVMFSGAVGELAHRYDSTGDRWEPLAPWPEFRTMPSCTAVGHTLHVFGGLTPRGDYPSEHAVYDARRNTWTATRAVIPADSEPSPDPPT
jgi:hypothetical protein